MQSHWDKLPTLRVVDAGYLLAGMEPERKWQFAPPLVKNFFNLIHEKTGAVAVKTMPDGRSEITQAEFQALKAKYGVTPATEPKATPDIANPEQTNYQETPQYQAEYAKAWTNPEQTNYQETPQYQAEYAKAWKSLDAKDELEKLIKESEAIPALDWGQLERKKQAIAAMKVEQAALLAGIFPGDSQQQAIEPQAAPVVAVGASDSVEPDKAGPLPVEQGLLTKDIAAAFDGVNRWSFERWTKNLSASKWLHPARIAIGGAGGASSVWNPAMLAQLMHDDAKGEREKEKLMKVLNSRFTRNPALGPWRDAFNEYFATYCATD